MAIKAKQLQPAKIQAIAETKAVFQDYNDFIFADYRGLTVEQITGLRKQLSEKKAVLKVVKNNYARVAFKEMEIDTVDEYLKGPTAIILGTEDANEVAKILFDFKKEAPIFDVKGALVEKEIYDAQKIEEFSKLPGKKQLIAMIASTINAPVQKLAATLQAYVDSKQAGGGNSAEEPQTEAAPAAEEKPAE
ncbi:MAG: 50S ribosomal protein L10 [Spirochaetales bacterium]